MTSSPLRLSAWTIVLALSLSSCGSPARTRPVATDHVSLPPSYLFSPADITVKVGTTVTWSNSDNFTHSVRIPAKDGKVIGIMHPGGQTTYTFATPGTYHYDCSFHPNNMLGSVVVTSP